jgi:hypothetical protein
LGAIVIGKNRIMIYGPKDDIYGPKDDGSYVVLSISIPRTEAHVIRHFQKRISYGLLSANS